MHSECIISLKLNVVEPYEEILDWRCGSYHTSKHTVIRMELHSDKLAPLSSGPLRFSCRSTCSRAEIGGSCSNSLVKVPAFISGDDRSLDTSL